MKSVFNFFHDTKIFLMNKAFKINTVIYLVNNTTYIGNNIKNSVTCFNSIEPSSSQIKDTVLVHSANA